MGKLSWNYNEQTVLKSPWANCPEITMSKLSWNYNEQTVLKLPRSNCPEITISKLLCNFCAKSVSIFKLYEKLEDNSVPRVWRTCPCQFHILFSSNGNFIHKCTRRCEASAVLAFQYIFTYYMCLCNVYVDSVIEQKEEQKTTLFFLSQAHKSWEKNDK